MNSYCEIDHQTSEKLADHYLEKEREKRTLKVKEAEAEEEAAEEKGKEKKKKAVIKVFNRKELSHPDVVMVTAPDSFHRITTV